MVPGLPSDIEAVAVISYLHPTWLFIELEGVYEAGGIDTVSMWIRNPDGTYHIDRCESNTPTWNAIRGLQLTRVKFLKPA